MKRFTDTDKWSDTWFHDLPTEYKLLWMYITDHCDAAGVWKVNFPLARFQTGVPIDETIALQALDGRIEDLGNGKWLVVKFIEFQYGKLSKDCRPHNRVFQLLENHGLSNRVLIDYPKVMNNLEEEEEDKGEGSVRGGIVNVWNEQVRLPKVTTPLSSARTAKLKVRLKERFFRDNVSVAIRKLGLSDFATGGSDSKWKASFDWLITNDTNIHKIMEGKYDNFHGASQPKIKILET